MSAVGSVRDSWARSQSGFTQGGLSRDGRVYQVFSKRPLDTMALFLFFWSITSQTMNGLARSAKEKIKECSLADLTDDKGPYFSYNFKKISSTITSYADCLANEFGQEGAISKGAREVQDLTGLSSKECIKCVELARSIALKHFIDLIYVPAFSIEAVDKWVLDVSLKINEHIYQSVGSVRGELPVAFSNEQLALFDITRAEITQDPKSMPCFAYALLYVGELEAKDCIFKKEAMGVFYDLFNLLTRLNYYSVPNPDKGDLVVYIADNKAQHMGVFIGDQLVHSKPGHQAHYSYNHKIFDVFPNYGWHVIFFRKGPDLS